MNIDQHPINFGYGEKTTINGVPYTHRGNDYPLTFEPVLINGTEIGTSGASGKVTGPHVHAQAGRDEWAQQTIDPTPFVGKAGVVIKTGFGDQWGNYLTVKVGDVNVFYCHLSAIKAHIGQKIGEEDMGRIEELLASEQRLAHDVVARDKRIEQLVARVTQLETSEQKLAHDVVARDKRIALLESQPQGDYVKVDGLYIRK